MVCSDCDKSFRIIVIVEDCVSVRVFGNESSSKLPFVVENNVCVISLPIGLALYHLMNVSDNIMIVSLLIWYRYVVM